MFMGAPRRHGCSLSAALALVLFFSTATGNGIGWAGVSREKKEQGLTGSNGVEDEGWEREAAGRRRLAGPGSAPPTCRFRCGRCFPCCPVHVAIQPGRSVPLEYYPEAWRCKCGNKLFMP